MPVTKDDLIPRYLHRVRVKIAYPGQAFSAQEREAMLTHIDFVNEVAYFTVGVVALKVPWASIVSIEGGLGPPLDQGRSQGSGLGTDNG